MSRVTGGRNPIELCCDPVVGVREFAEREIRPAAVMRKVSYGSASERGVTMRAVLMSVYRTLKKRALDPLAETRTALETLAKTGTLPPLPDQHRSTG
jgi:hypothetical protein